MKHQVKVSSQVIEFLSHLAPAPRKKLKEGLRGLAELSGDLKELEGPLAGFYRLRVARYRVIFDIKEDIVYCIFAEQRNVIYETFEKIVGMGGE
ncbi:MAG: hypothetical protein A2Y14_01265 [Verrucomicrobia bacterium GWF2_51_19]|nr:MAG: hypothetical protein A2Y14_01265 [Verrucomicrobia bacterium GWF2_51_19]HCJ11705.1 hypothetical protein [Opitutae bacterium]